MSTVLRNVGLGLLLAIRVIVALAVTVVVWLTWFTGLVVLFVPWIWDVEDWYLNPLPLTASVWSWAIKGGGRFGNRSDVPQYPGGGPIVLS